jgi:hypothetical protein
VKEGHGHAEKRPEDQIMQPERRPASTVPP